MVAAATPLNWRRLADARHYIESGALLVKRVAATKGDLVCAAGAELFANGRDLAVRLARDGRGRPMIWWQGCRPLRPNEVLLLNADHPDSFDGRYFGPTPVSDIVGTATLLWRS